MPKACFYVVASTEAYRHDNMTRTRCLNAGFAEVNGRKGRMLICPDRECGYSKGIASLTNARCPECRKRMELKGEGEGRLFTCSCGCEKLSSFNKRMEEKWKAAISVRYKSTCSSKKKSR